MSDGLDARERARADRLAAALRMLLDATDDEDPDRMQERTRAHMMASAALADARKPAGEGA